MRIPSRFKKITHDQYIFGDFDNDGSPNADDVAPFDSSKSDDVQEVRLTDELRAIKRHNETYRAPARKLAKKIGADKYRIKGTHSTIGKLRRNFLEEGKIDDVAGVRVVHKDFPSLKANVKLFEKKYKSQIKGDKADDYYKDPKGGYYMAYHLGMVEDKKLIEVQMKTKRQALFHEDTHKFYKTYKKPSKKRLARLKKKAMQLHKLDMKK